VYLSLMLTSLILVCSTAFAEPIEDRLRPPLAAGHRGGMTSLSNNTLEQFRKALTYPAEIIEMDLRLSRDGVVMVFHDPDLSPDTRCKGPIESKTFAEIQKCKLSRTGHLIPSFAQVLDLVRGQKIIDAEFKTEEVVAPAVQLAQKYQAQEWVYFQAQSDTRKYNIARQSDSRIGLLFKANTLPELDWALALNDPRLLIIEFDEDLLSTENLRRVRAQGKLIRANAWRFDSTRELFGSGCEKLYKMGVSIVHTNRPDLCHRQKKAYREP
jgi:glycerophosphoryl diester phosphodiesterase